MLKKYIFTFGLAFALNWIWEILHSLLYASYKGGAITSFVLFRAALADAVLITVIILISLRFPKKRSWLIIIVGLALAVVIEKWALGTGRWEYGPWMPVIPFLETGLTPTIQLAATGYITLRLIYLREAA